MSTRRMTRRTLTATAGGFAAGIFAAPYLHAAAQDATPQSAGATPVVTPTPLGYVSARLRSAGSADVHDRYMNELVNNFAPRVPSIDGFEGYLVGNLIDDPAAHISITVLDEEAQYPAFADLASDFVQEEEDALSTTVDTREWAGDLLIASGPTGTNATPAATPVSSGSTGYIAMRVHPSLPGADPREFVPLAKSGFLPIVTGLPGFRGYLWYPTDGAFVAIGVFDSEAAAQESNTAARDWAEENLTAYTSTEDTIVINANIAYANMPIFR